MPVSAWTNLAGGKGEPAWAALYREFRAAKTQLILHVKSWQQYNPPQPLTWHSVPYASAQSPIDKRGVYAFVLDANFHSPAPFPPHSVVLYVGETGDTSKGTLRKRLQNYRNVKAQRDRPRVWPMLDLWGPYLQFYYAEVAAGVSTKACERALLDALLPPVNDKDYSATVDKARKAAFAP